MGCWWCRNLFSTSLSGNLPESIGNLTAMASLWVCHSSAVWWCYGQVFQEADAKANPGRGKGVAPRLPQMGKGKRLKRTIITAPVKSAGLVRESKKVPAKKRKTATKAKAAKAKESVSDSGSD